jgi:hypothetical protein
MKFTCKDSKRLYGLAMEGAYADDEFGDSCDWFYYAWLFKREQAILVEDASGHVYVEFFVGDDEGLNKAWANMQALWIAYDEPDIGADDEERSRGPCDSGRA